MKEFIRQLVVCIFILLGTCFIQGNLDVFGWEKKVRIITVLLMIIVLLANSFIKEMAKFKTDDETDDETTI